jgi:hypothetical protein
MNKRTRQYLGLFSAVLAYYSVHEGAHLLYALGIGVFRRIRFLGLGVQIDVYAERMTDVQMGIFCLLGAAATSFAAWALTAAAGRLTKHPSKALKACLYYVTAAMLLIDPLYLSLLCGFVGGGDMNGITLLVPQLPARLLFGAQLVAHAGLFLKVVLPTYKQSFERQ